MQDFLDVVVCLRLTYCRGEGNFVRLDKQKISKTSVHLKLYLLTENQLSANCRQQFR